MSRVSIKGQQDLLAGLFFAIVAAAGLWVSRGYRVGSAMDMDMGYMPRLLLWILLGLGLAIMLRGLVLRGEAVGSWVLRPMIMIVAAFFAFGITVERFGMVIACTLLIVLGSHAGSDVRYKELAIATIGLVSGATIVFVQLIGLPIKVWPGF